MHLVNMDVDQYGNGTYHLGPLSPGLNAIYGPAGSGKAALLSWLRQIAAENHGAGYAGSTPLSPNLSSVQRGVTEALAAASGVADTEAALESLAKRLLLDDSPSAHALEQRQERIKAELHRCQQEIEQLDREIETARGQLTRCEAERDAREAERDARHGVEQKATEINEAFRNQLRQLDGRLHRWRQTLRDLKSQRERLEHNASHARLDRQFGDQLGSNSKSDPRAALRSLEAQIVHTRSQLDVLVDRYSAQHTRPQPAAPALPDQDVRVRRDASGRTRVTITDHLSPLPDIGQLPETLRSMQHELQEVFQQLAQHEATTAAESLKQQSRQLKRCEAELLQSVEKLIDERAQLLRKIAVEHQLSVEQVTLRVGQWCPSHDRASLHDWLMQDEAPTPSTVGIEDVGIEDTSADDAARQRLTDHLRRLEAQREQASARGEQCRQQELAQVRQELARLPLHDASGNRFWTSVDRHILGLVGPRDRRDLTTAFAEALSRHGSKSDSLQAQPPSQLEYEVPGGLVRVAMRLAIVEAVAAQGNSVPLILDRSLDALSADEQRAAVAYLASRASGGQQVVVLTGEERIAELVRAQGGYVGYQRATRPLAGELDINRQLAAYANDHEVAKWSQAIEHEAATPSAISRGECFLNDRSLIEDLPSLDAMSAARCRALGIDRVGDLLDIDPHWLAKNLRLDAVGGSAVMRWQAEARLLCSVRKLRPFDARVLVGAGIDSPQQLSEMHPSDLLDRVECFLATDRGRSILRSGSSYELTRITSWIAAAKIGTQRYQPARGSDGKPSGDARRQSRSKATARQGSRRNGSTKKTPNARRRSQRVRLADTHSLGDANQEATFHLELFSPLIDAPSIGPRMAARLEQLGITTVDQLLSANAETLADNLNLRRLDAATIRAWQEQSRLVCRIPNLRPHEAQLLVACDVTSPEELAAMNASTVLSQVLEVAQSDEGERILRGSTGPDLAEVSRWIASAASSRRLHAA